MSIMVKNNRNVDHTMRCTRYYPAVLSILLITLIVVFTLPCSGQTGGWGTGLEVANFRDVPLVIEHLPEDADRIRLRGERVRTRTELLLRSAGLRPVSHEGDQFLYVKVNVVERAFTVSLEFKRPVSYTIGGDRRLTKIGTVWNASVTGTHANDPGYVLSILDELLERFLNEYLAANEAG